MYHVLFLNQQVSVSAAVRLAVARGEKGAAGGLGYGFVVLDALVGGALLYTTLAATLPREARDAAAEWSKLKAGGSSGISGGVSGGRPLQFARVFTLFVGWLAMAACHWPILAPSFME